MNLLIRIREAVDRKLLNFFLQKIKRHLSKQDGIIIYKYDREVDSLSPVIWRARAITKNTIKEKKATNNWLENLSKLDVALHGNWPLVDQNRYSTISPPMPLHCLRQAAVSAAVMMRVGVRATEWAKWLVGLAGFVSLVGLVGLATTHRFVEHLHFMLAVCFSHLRCFAFLR